MLVFVASYSRLTSYDMKNDFMPLLGLQPFKLFFFFGNLTVEQYYKSLANKSNSQESPFLHFLQYDPKEVRVLTDLIFFSFGLADDQKSFNATCNIFFFFFFFCIFVQPLWIPFLF